MNGEALGVIEAVGMAAAIEAADSCVKSANVELIGYELTKGSGLVAIKIRGNVGAVKAAIEAAKASASRINKVYATLIIPRPSAGLERIIEPNSVSEIKENVKEDIEEEIREDIREDVEEDIKVEIKEDGKEDIKKDIKDSINEDTIENVKEDIEEDIKEYTKLVDTDNYYENEQEDENKVNDHKNSNEFLNGGNFLNEESDDICNICHDPRCQRKKGQPRNLCIHYKRT